jgi:hypothetical protein
MENQSIVERLWQFITPYMPYIVSGVMRVFALIAICHGLYWWLERTFFKKGMPRELKATAPIGIAVVLYLLFPHKELSTGINVFIGACVGTFSTSVYEAMARRLLTLLTGGLDAAARKVKGDKDKPSGNSPTPPAPPAAPTGV